jgi:hypothetical protein
VFDEASYTSTRSTLVDIGTDLSNRRSNLEVDGGSLLLRELDTNSKCAHLSAFFFFLAGSETRIRHG